MTSCRQRCSIHTGRAGVYATALTRAPPHSVFVQLQGTQFEPVRSPRYREFGLRSGETQPSVENQSMARPKAMDETSCARREGHG